MHKRSESYGFSLLTSLMLVCLLFGITSAQANCDTIMASPDMAFTNCDDGSSATTMRVGNIITQDVTPAPAYRASGSLYPQHRELNGMSQFHLLVQPALYPPSQHYPLTPVYPYHEPLQTDLTRRFNRLYRD